MIEQVKKILDGIVMAFGKKASMAWIKANLTEEKIKAAIDGAFDRIEDLAESTGTKLDDITVLPALRKIREVLGIPDND